ncbi:SLAP domain-containing protein [Brevibacillus daliensis]|uniref:SLAP domain-containing protein n=1 Tax=Brevibacillus daliensis TaxID=2892995 RepID=UPI001E3F62F2|nr:SLAP domain-containing protein [Brevibacillus daliensis]
MFSFLKSWLNKDSDEMRNTEELKKDLSQTSVNRIEEKTAEQRKEVDLELSLHPMWDMNLDQSKKYALGFINEGLPKIPEGTFAVTGFSLIPREKGVTVSMFLRNASSKPINLKDVDLILKIEDQIFAEGNIDLSHAGEIPPYSSRPWEATFADEFIVYDRSLDFSNWSLAIRMGQPEYIWPKTLEIDPQMEAKMTDSMKKKLHFLVENLPPLQEGTISFTGYDVGLAKNGQLVAAMLIRNATRNTYNGKKWDIVISNTETNKIVAQGRVDASRVKVQAGHSRPWILVFPADKVKNTEDLTKKNWAIQVKEV